MVLLIITEGQQAYKGTVLSNRGCVVTRLIFLMGPHVLFCFVFNHFKRYRVAFSDCFSALDVIERAVKIIT